MSPRLQRLCASAMCRAAGHTPPKELLKLVTWTVILQIMKSIGLHKTWNGQFYSLLFASPCEWRISQCVSAVIDMPTNVMGGEMTLSHTCLAMSLTKSLINAIPSE